MNNKRKVLYISNVYSLIILLTIGGAFAPFRAYGQKVLSTSEQMRPKWLADKTPVPSNNTFQYQITEGEHYNLEDAKKSCLLNLSTYIKQTNGITSTGDAQITVNNTDARNSESENYNFVYQIKGEELIITFDKADEYWERIMYPNGTTVYRCYTLYAVANGRSAAKFDQLRFSRKYGARGFARSLIVPGWGQMYKGSTVKGCCILGGEVLLAGGIIISESLRSSYVKKMRENPKHLKTYNTKADNFENIRNVCIGGAAALYVYNLIDALVANGRKRSIIKKYQFTMTPVATPECNGVSFAFKF